MLHEFSASGNCYKVRLTAALVGKPLERRADELDEGETRTPDFIANVNANGRILVLQVGDRFIPESNAACYFVAEGSPLLPTDPFDHADMLHWMFWEQYSHEPNIATLRFWMGWLAPDNLSDLQRLQMPTKRTAGNAALKLMDERLDGTRLARRKIRSASPTSACSSTPTSPDEADFDLGALSKDRGWIERIMRHPHIFHWLNLARTAVGLYRRPSRPLRKGRP